MAMSITNILTLAFVGRVIASKRVGTPAVVYDVPGLRDSTRDGQTGLVCRRNTPSALAQAILSLHAQPLLYARLREQAWVSIKELSWDRTARAAWSAVESCL
jgi:glycosyltransferase involved in cell wall biosynthesis